MAMLVFETRVKGRPDLDFWSSDYDAVAAMYHNYCKWYGAENVIWMEDGEVVK